MYHTDQKNHQPRRKKDLPLINGGDLLTIAGPKDQCKLCENLITFCAKAENFCSKCLYNICRNLLKKLQLFKN